MIKFITNSGTVSISNIRFGKRDSVIHIKKIITNGKVLWERIKEIVSGVFNSGIWISNNIWVGSEIWKNN